MRPPPTLRAWLTPAEFPAWVKTAPDKDTFQRRLAISLVVCERRHVPEVARMLFVAPRTVWYWLAQYDTHGPAAATAAPRGGRRDALLPLATEAAILAQFHDAALRGEIVTASAIRGPVEQAVGGSVSTKYLRDLLGRHDWRKLAPRPHHPKADPDVQTRYKKFSAPHSGRGKPRAAGPASAPALRR
jgi:transposase